MTSVVTETDLRNWLADFTRLVTEQKEYLTELDSAIGDADHGINMARGMHAVSEKLASGVSGPIGPLFKTVGMTLVTSVGGASGPLYGTLFLRFGTASGDVEELDGAALSKALHAGLDGVVARGKAELGDKTMVDALQPAIAAYDDAIAATPDDLGAATRAAAVAAAAGRDAAAAYVARKGRASYLGERSGGHIDPGTASTSLLFDALSATVNGD